MRRNAHYSVRLLVAGAVGLTLGGCATKRDVRSLRDDLLAQLQDLAAQQESLIQELRRETASTQDTLRTQSEQLFGFRGAINQQLRGIAESLATLEAIAGENQRAIAGIRDQLANMRQIALRGGADLADPGPGDAPMAREGGDAEVVFNAAIVQFNRGSRETARQAFRQFLDAHPNHDLAPDAHYYLADLLVQDDRLDEAIDAFNAVGELFPEALKVPEALYRVALIHIERGDTDEAASVLERIVNTYPELGIAMLARDKLNEIR